MIKDKIIELIKIKFDKIKQFLNEKTIRLWCAIEAITLGYGGITAIHKATNVSIRTIQRGIAEYNRGDFCANDRIRKTGGGRKKIKIKN